MCLCPSRLRKSSLVSSNSGSRVLLESDAVWDAFRKDPIVFNGCYLSLPNDIQIVLRELIKFTFQHLIYWLHVLEHVLMRSQHKAIVMR